MMRGVWSDLVDVYRTRPSIGFNIASDLKMNPNLAGLVRCVTVGSLGRLFAVGLLRPSARELLELTWTQADQRRLDRFGTGIRTVNAVLRDSDRYHRARARGISSRSSPVPRCGGAVDRHRAVQDIVEGLVEGEVARSGSRIRQKCPAAVEISILDRRAPRGTGRRQPGRPAGYRPGRRAPLECTEHRALGKVSRGVFQRASARDTRILFADR
ncbi:oxygenase MpaB family protein [Nocardia brasiliensis]